MNTFRMKAVEFHIEFYTFSIKYILHTYSQPKQQQKADRSRTIETISVHYLQPVILYYLQPVILHYPPTHTHPFQPYCSFLRKGKPACLVLSGPIAVWGLDAWSSLLWQKSWALSKMILSITECLKTVFKSTSFHLSLCLTLKFQAFANLRTLVATLSYHWGHFTRKFIQCEYPQASELYKIIFPLN